jgi:type I restriction enzyme S subunit
MIADLKPYAAMRDSGIEWLGRVPQHWDVLRGRRLFEIRKRIVGELSYPVVSVTQEGLRFKDVETGKGQLSQDYSKYQIVKAGEFAMNSMDLLTGGVGIAASLSVTSPDYRVFAIRDESRCHERYMLHVLRLLYLNKGFYAWGQGSAQLGRWRLPRKRFNDYPFPVPPLSEQAAIVRFLCYVNRRIRRYINAKQKLIKLLEDQKQAIIHCAVTRGLEQNFRTKPSGVEWLGDVPEQWVIKPLKWWAAINVKTIGESTDPDWELRYIDIGTVKTGRLVREPERMCFRDSPSRARRVLRRGDTIVSTVRTYLKAVWYVAEEDVEHLIASTGFAVLTPLEDVEPEYLGYVIQSSNFIDRVTARSVGTAYPAINESALGRFLLTIPPTRSEQQKLIRWIKKKVTPINRAIEQAQKVSDLLREYRTRLIADVVTGKLDVREVASRLPDESEEELLEENDTVPEEAEA